VAVRFQLLVVVGLIILIQLIENVMGQAKLRGSFEKRQAEGIIKREEAAKQKILDEAARRHNLRMKQLERKANMTPEQRQRARASEVLLAAVMGIAASGSKSFIR